MPPSAKSEVVRRAREGALGVEVDATHVEFVRTGESAVVTVGGAEKTDHFRLCRDRAAAHFEIGARLTRDHVGGRGVTQRFRQSAVDQRTVGPQRRELLGMRHKIADERGQSLLHRLAAGEDHQHAEANDFVVGQLLALDLDLRQHRQQARARGSAALRHQRPQIGVEFVAGRKTGGRHFRIADQVDAEAQQGGVPFPEPADIGLRQPDDGRQDADRERGDEVADELDLAAVPEASDQAIGQRRNRRSEFRLKPVGAERRSEQPPLSRVVASVELHDGDAENRLNLRRIAAGRELRVGHRLADIVVPAQDVGVRARVEIEGEFLAHDPVKRIGIAGELGREDIWRRHIGPTRRSHLSVSLGGDARIGICGRNVALTEGERRKVSGLGLQEALDVHVLCAEVFNAELAVARPLAVLPERDPMQQKAQARSDRRRRETGGSGRSGTAASHCAQDGGNPARPNSIPRIHWFSASPRPSDGTHRGRRHAPGAMAPAGFSRCDQSSMVRRSPRNSAANSIGALT